MTRVFLGISSSSYEDSEHLPQLDGTIIDGQNIQKVLLDKKLGGYDAPRSKLLISPTLIEVQNTIKESLFSDENIDCFTLYFAGHGISHMGTYYLCLRDTYTDKLSATALALNYIFNIINDSQPLQTNIIIDACEAGGLVGDLGALIKPEVFGDANSPGVSLFGSCMRNQTASEDDSGGFATQELLKCISGEECIDTRWPFLDLVQIGRNVSVELKEKGHEQTPVIWGLSLTGSSTFSKNPHYQSTKPAASTTIAMHTFISDDLNIIQDKKERIWEHYLKIPRTGVTPSLINSLVESVKDLKDKGMSAAKIGSFLLGTAEGLAMRVSEREDLFSEVEVFSACGVAFLPIIEEAGSGQSFLVLLDKIMQGAVKVVEEMHGELSEPNTLLSGHTGLNDLFFLPLRISKILGWLSLLQKMQNILGDDNLLSNDRFKEIIEKISSHYLLSFACVSEEQAPYLMLYSQAQGYKEGDETFLLPIRCYLSDFIERQGKILISDTSGEDTLNYLVGRYKKDYTGIQDILAQPTELLSVLLDAAAIGNLDDEIDPYLRRIDHMPFNIFIPNEINTFSDNKVENGTNITMQIGSESGNGVFTIEDFRNNFNNFCNTRIHSLQDGKNEESKIAMALASFMMPDRVAWVLRDIKNSK